MIINVRGTHGSGKSHLFRSLIQKYPHSPEGVNRRGGPENYRVIVPWLVRPVYVVGNYENPCGGCDAIQPCSEIWPRVERFYEMGHVLFEGALVSSSYGNIGRASERYGDRFVFAFLNTPLKLCLQRLGKRRLARGDERPLNPANTESKFRNIQRSIHNLKGCAGRRVVILDYRYAADQLLGLLRRGDLEEAGR